MVGDVMDGKAEANFYHAFDEAIARIFEYADEFEDPVLIYGKNKIFARDLTDTLNAYGPRDIAENFGGDIESWEKATKERIREDDSLLHYGWGLPGVTALDFIRTDRVSHKDEIIATLRSSWLTPASDAWGDLVDKLTAEIDTSWRGWDLSGSGCVRVPFSEFDVNLYLYEVFDGLDDHDCATWGKS